ncbi:MAG: hypothetical protein LBH72_07795 [Proteiniphilum sp.]|jgi:hypothetical protein|nr:hypothetical protein [Proteiniphilum sp.]
MREYILSIHEKGSTAERDANISCGNLPASACEKSVMRERLPETDRSLKNLHKFNPALHEVILSSRVDIFSSRTDVPFRTEIFFSFAEDVLNSRRDFPVSREDISSPRTATLLHARIFLLSHRFFSSSRMAGLNL